ncbi:MAG TPA: beta-ketoacyl-[acyl-carrier-protein] synthase family protein [Planctomycetota bacterium]|nr:beta-ketoacyl-[acyl-carrier-protein] synthase family protein [Planctomycetota bacterium]
MRRVVITGLGPVTPIGTGTEALVDGLCSSRSGIGPIEIFDASTFPTTIAAQVRDLDPRSVLGEATESVLADRKIALAVLAARLALEDAFGEARAPGGETVLLSLGIGLELLLLQHMVREPPDEHFLRVPLDRGPREIARRFGVSGPIATHVTACVAGSQAIGQAFRAVRRGECAVALAGGADSMVNPMGLGGFSLLSALSRRNDLGPRACRPFDRSRDGLVLGEGAGVLVLEERERALARGAKIHAEVLGYGTSLDAFHVTAPPLDGEGAARAMRAAYRDAGISPDEIDYVNAHGTSTPQNDPAETRALKTALGERARAIPVSSTKSQIGHTISAAGAIEAIVTALALERSIVPPTINLEEPDVECDLDYVPGVARTKKLGIAQSNSFGFGGQNAILILGASDDR